MFKTIETAIELDPYNIDAYYFAQAAFTWGVGRARDVNRLLAYGMRYRTWDYYLPYFAGFNASYFLKKPEEAAVYYKKAAELSGKAFFASLAARYLYEADQTPIAISFLSMMIEKSTDTSEKAIYTKRLEALKAAQVILKGVEQYENRYGRRPKTLQEVVASSILSDIPVDPYGGTFYLDEKGKVRTTSQLAPVNSGQNYSPIIRP
jgi:tetratricopeptide (TPR) repeat protein